MEVKYLTINGAPYSKGNCALVAMITMSAAPSKLALPERSTVRFARSIRGIKIIISSSYMG